MKHAAPVTEEHARPVAYLLVRNMAPPDSDREQMRTRIGWGCLTNETRNEITDAGFWDIGGIVGPFESDAHARTFVELWTSSSEEFAESKTTRGPIMRIAKACVLADLFTLDSWIDAQVLISRRLHHYRLAIRDGAIIAEPLVATT